jgi:two-component system LytT family response regulator
MKIRTLIVDDMSLARERLKHALAADAEIEVVGEAANGRESVGAIWSLTPDLVFLDVQMPHMDGFEVVEEIGAERMPAVVFVTAFDEFALRAFEVNALDYLLKPFEEERLSKTVERVKRQLKKGERGSLEEKLLKLLDEVPERSEYVKRIPVKTAQYTVLVVVEDIDWVGGAGNYMELNCG